MVNGKALPARPKYYNKLLKHWNTESGFSVRSYDDFIQAVPITQQLYSILGFTATNLVAAFSGAIPPWFGSLSPLELQGLIARPLLGSRPEYNAIPLIKTDRYAALCVLPDAAISTDEFWLMRKFEYYAMFAKIAHAKIAEHWEIFREFRRKLFNIQKEFGMQISDLESFSNNK